MLALVLALGVCVAGSACTRSTVESAPASARGPDTPERPGDTDTRQAPKPTADFTAPDAQGWGRAGELHYLEVITGGADRAQRLPLVVMIHGLGDRARNVWVTPEQAAAGTPMRVVMPQAPIPHGGGFAWFPFRVGDPDQDALARGIAHAASQLARALELLARRRPTAGAPIVGGFSQGGMLSFALALRHPQTLGAAFPVSGLLPRPLWPTAAVAGAPAIVAIHGDADDIVPIAPARALVHHLASLGQSATLHEYAGVGHQVTPAMSARLGALIDAAARAAAETPARVTP